MSAGHGPFYAILGALLVVWSAPGRSLSWSPASPCARLAAVLTGWLQVLGMGIGGTILLASRCSASRRCWTGGRWLHLSLKIAGGLYLAWPSALGFWRGAGDPLAPACKPMRRRAPRCSAPSPSDC